MKNLKIGFKLLIGFGIVTLLLIIGGISAYYDATILSNFTEKFYAQAYTLGLTVRDAEIGENLCNELLHDLTLATSPQKVDELRTEIELQKAENHKYLALIKDKFEGDANIITRLGELSTSKYALFDQIIKQKQDLLVNGSTDALPQTTSEVFTELNNNLNLLKAQITEQGLKFKQDGLDTSKYIHLKVIIFYIVAAIIAILFSIIIPKGIIKPLTFVTESVQRISRHTHNLSSLMRDNLAAGDWSKTMNIQTDSERLEVLQNLTKRRDELGMIATANKSIIDEILEASSNINLVYQASQ